MSWQVRQGDALTVLRTLEPQSVQTVVTSPPYWGLRDYGNEGQLGLEPTPDAYVASLVEVFREVRRVLRDDGTVWLNLGDSYASVPGANNGNLAEYAKTQRGGGHRAGDLETPRRPVPSSLKPKDLCGIPWRVAFALQADGWYLRSDVIWSKPNPMPESVTDRPTRSHEYIFLLSKSARYLYDADAVRESVSPASDFGGAERPAVEEIDEWMPSAIKRQSARLGNGSVGDPAGRNKRSVWSVATQPYAEAHFATFPPKLIEPCILAGSAEGDTVLDPFAGSGTTGLVALRHNRSFIGIELNSEYVEMARNRICDDAPLLNTHLEAA